MLTSAPDEESRFHTEQTDAPGIGIEAVLCQEEENDHPIAYFSRKLLPSEGGYSTAEKECLPIVLSVKHFQAYLL